MRQPIGSQLARLSTTLRVIPVVERFLRRVIPQPVQRIGAHALERVMNRFPKLRELVDTARRAIDFVESSASQATSSAVVSPSPNGAEASLADLSSPSWSVRAMAARKLETGSGRLSDDAERALVAALRDESAEVAASAALALGARGTSRAFQALRSVLTNSDGFFNPVCRAACVQGIGRLPASSEVVLGAFRDVDAEVSLAAIATAAERFPDLAAERLAALLTERSGYYLPLVRVAAARALVSTHAGSRHFDSILSSEYDPEVRDVLERAKNRT